MKRALFGMLQNLGGSPTLRLCHIKGIFHEQNITSANFASDLKELNQHKAAGYTLCVIIC